MFRLFRRDMQRRLRALHERAQDCDNDFYQGTYNFGFHGFYY